VSGWHGDDERKHVINKRVERLKHINNNSLTHSLVSRTDSLQLAQFDEGQWKRFWFQTHAIA